MFLSWQELYIRASVRPRPSDLITPAGSSIKIMINLRSQHAAATAAGVRSQHGDFASCSDAI
jgi:hypothetical protein